MISVRVFRNPHPGGQPGHGLPITGAGPGLGTGPVSKWVGYRSLFSKETVVASLARDELHRAIIINFWESLRGNLRWLKQQRAHGRLTRRLVALLNTFADH